MNKKFFIHIRSWNKEDKTNKIIEIECENIEIQIKDFSGKNEFCFIKGIEGKVEIFENKGE
jgi:hypothetical protein